jgi:hypothetical protein
VNDADGDGVLNSSDNCPNWFNPTQTLPSWSIPANDPDCDGFATAVESFVGTNSTHQCGASAWPVDVNNDGKVTLADIAPLVLAFDAVAPNAPYSVRYDLTRDGKITLGDIVYFVLFFNRTCSP